MRAEGLGASYVEGYIEYILRNDRIMRYLGVIATLAVVVACTVPSRAESVIPAKLSVADAVGIALGLNPDLKQAEEAKRASMSKLRIASYHTSLNFGSSTSLQRAPGSSDLSSLVSTQLSYESPFGTTGAVAISPLGMGSKHGALGLSLTQPLSKGSGMFSSKGLALKSAQSDVTVQNKQLFLSRQATVQGVVEAYYGAVLAREEVKVREQAVKFAEEAADGWRKREKEGSAAGIDVTRSDIQVSQTKNALNSQQRTARNSLDQLMIAIGSGVGETPELTDAVPQTEITTPALADAVNTALANRAELTVYDERLGEQARQLARAKDQLRPQLDLVARFNGAGDSTGLIGRSIFDQGLLATGIEYSIPLDQRVSQENRDTATRQLDVLRNLRLFQMDQITEQVRSAYRRVDSARASLAILAQNKTTAMENLRIANRMMEEGEGSSRDILDAQQAITEVDSSLLSADTDLYLAAIDLKRAMGEDITQMGFK
jgi:outer membrane protein